MSAHLRSFERELFLAAFALPTARLDGWVLDRLSAITEERRVRAGDLLWRAGDPVRALWFMRDGRVRFAGAGAPSWTFEGQWFLGAFEGHRGEVARRDAIALADFHALSASPRDWFALLEDSFDLTRALTTAAAAAVAAIDERLPNGIVAPPRLAGAFDAGDRALGVVGRLALLTELEMARGAGVQALAELAAASREVTFDEGELLVRAGDPRDCFYLVASGAIEARRSAPDVVRRYHATEIVGGAAAFTERACDWEARARSRSQVIAVPLEAWFDLMEDHVDLAHSFLGVLGAFRERALDALAEAAGPEGVVLTSR